MNRYIFIMMVLLLIISCSSNRDTTFITANHQKIQTIGFDHSGNLYVIKYKNTPNVEILKKLLEHYKNLQPRYLKHVNSVSITIKNENLKEIITDFLQAGQIEYIERTPVKKTF